MEAYNIKCQVEKAEDLLIILMLINLLALPFRTGLKEISLLFHHG